MSKICSHFDAYFEKWRREAGALCFLLTRDRSGADYACFQSFLRLGGAKDPDVGEEEARTLLFASALRLCEDFYLKKMRRTPSPAALRALSLPFPITDALCAFLRLPFARRAALALGQFGFSAEEIAALLHRSVKRTQKLLADPGIPGWQEAVASAMMTDEEAQLLSDRIYERFAERSVGVENAIHDLRSAFDRVAPFLALAVIALIAFSVWFVSR